MFDKLKSKIGTKLNVKGPYQNVIMLALLLICVPVIGVIIKFVRSLGTNITGGVTAALEGTTNRNTYVSNETASGINIQAIANKIYFSIHTGWPWEDDDAAKSALMQVPKALIPQLIKEYAKVDNKGASLIQEWNEYDMPLNAEIRALLGI